MRGPGIRPALRRVPVKRQQELVRRFYDVSARPYSELWGEHIHDGYYSTGHESREEAQENLVRYLADAAGVGAGDRVLDVGCGLGGSSIWLTNHCGASMLGITISPVQVNMARQTAAERRADCTFLLMDAAEMRFEDTFDVIWAVAVCTHLPDQPGFLRSAVSYLRPGGRFVIFDWMLGNRASGIAAHRQRRAVSRGMLLADLYAMPEYLRWLTALGCRVVKSADITAATIRTWDDALEMVRRPAVWKLVASLANGDLKHAVAFLRGLSAIKSAMEKGRLIAGAIVAEKT